MQILVTGATGFLGGYLLSACLEGGHEVRALRHRTAPQNSPPDVKWVQGDLGDERSLRAACRGVDAVIHAAAHKGLWSRVNREQRHVNVEGTSYLLRSAHKQGVARVVYVSSVAAVGASTEPIALDESAHWNLSRLKINYATTKREAEERAQAAAWAGMDVVVVNPSALVGARAHGTPGGGFVRSVRERRMTFVPPGGISATHPEDVARATVRALEQGEAGERYILAGHNVTYRELFQAAAEVAGVPAPTKQLSVATCRRRAKLCELKALLRLERPPWTQEVWRSFGLYSWFDSAKAQSALDYQTRPLLDSVRDSAGREPSL